MITLFHFDTPSAFKEDYWLSEEIIEHFGAYARICYAAFGDRVKSWITFNDPYIYSIFAYEIGVFPPVNTADPGVNIYKSVQNLLKAHAVAYHIYQDEFKRTQKGRVGIVVDSPWSEPANPSSDSDVQAAERVKQFTVSCQMS